VWGGCADRTFLSAYTQSSYTCNTYTANPIFSHPPEAKFMNLQFEVSGHYLESSNTRGLCMGFLNKGGVVFCQVFLLSPLLCTVGVEVVEVA
jgi:hypothetical protein